MNEKSKQSDPSQKMPSPKKRETEPGPTNARRGKTDWIGEQFKRVYDATAQEPLPEDMQKLLDALDELETPETRKSGVDDDG